MDPVITTNLTSHDNGWGSNVRSYDLSERAWSPTEAARLEIEVSNLAMDVAVGFYRPNQPGCTTGCGHHHHYQHRQLEPPSPHPNRPIALSLPLSPPLPPSPPVAVADLTTTTPPRDQPAALFVCGLPARVVGSGRVQRKSGLAHR